MMSDRTGRHGLYAYPWDVAEQAPAWLWKEWANMMRLRDDGVPIIGFTWYSLLDQVDWDTALREDNGRVHPVGLYDLDRNIRPVGTAYRQLMHNWRNVLPTQSVCLRVPIVLPDEMEEQWAVRGRAQATQFRVAWASAAARPAGM